MDAFKINWNDKMKTDMFVNKILNGDTSKDRFTFESDDTGIWRGYQFRMGRPDVSYPTVFQIFKDAGDNVRNIKFEDNRRLYDNTAPHSLYNLRYVSLR